MGADGATHAGAFDIAYLGCLPNMMLMAASDEVELARMVATAVAYNDGPCAFRYPRGNGFGLEIPEKAEPLEIGRGRIVREGSDVAILSYGARLQECVQAADMLATKNISTTVADARFAKPLDTKLIERLIKNHKAVVTIEEGSTGGFGALVMHFAANAGLLDTGTCKLRTMHLPDMFQDHDKPEKQYDEAGLNAAQIVRMVLSIS